jgi:Amt family ammonium transporter
LVGAGLVGAAIALPAGVAAAQAEPVYDGTYIPTNTDLGVSFNLFFILVGAALVVFMQAGFALVETGMTRKKHAAHVVSTNFAIFGIGFVAFMLVGFPLAFGGFSYPGYFGFDGSLGTSKIALGDWTLAWWGGWSWMTNMDAAKLAPIAVFFLYMVAFMDTTATIPTGAMAERWKWKSFVGWGLFCGALYYPLFAAWTWGGGWLNQLGNNLELGFGYVDFAGSGIVHATGGIASLAGAIVLGPRIGKYDKHGNPRSMPGHSLPMAFLGTFILLFGWFGFNAMSTLAGTDVRFTVAAVNTAIAGAFGATFGMFYIMQRKGFKKPDPGMMINGMLAGLVAITAPCAFVEPWAAAVIGIMAAVIVIESIIFIEKKGIDDPVGAISVHGVGGILGVLSVGIFSSGKYGAGWNLTTEGSAASATGVTGILYDVSLGAKQLAAQSVGALTIIFVMGGIALAFFKIQNALTKGGIRPPEQEEIDGLDIIEMGVVAYPEDEVIVASEYTPAVTH